MSRWRARVRGLVVASHAGPAAMVTFLAAAFAVGVGAGASLTVLITAAVLTGQLSVGWSNDWIDAPRDLAVRRAGKPVVDGLVTSSFLRDAALVALVVCCVLSLATGAVPGTVHLVAVASAWAYNLRLKSTVLSWLPYAVSFGLLPLFVVLALPGDEVAAGWTMLATALLGVGAHVANTLPDLEDDAATGVRGLPHRLGRRVASVVAPSVLVVATAVVILGPVVAGSGGGIEPAAWVGGAVAVVLAVGAGVVGGRAAPVGSAAPAPAPAPAPRSRLPFTLSLAVAAVCVVLLILAGPEIAVPLDR